MFGGPFLFKVVWKILFKNPCLNRVFWNHLGADFKQQDTSFSGTSVINWTLLYGPTWSAFFQVCLLSLLSSLHAQILSTWYEDHTVNQSNPELSPTSITPLTNLAPFHLHNSPHRPIAIKSTHPSHSQSVYTTSPTSVNHINPFLRIIIPHLRSSGANEKSNSHSSKGLVR